MILGTIYWLGVLDGALILWIAQAVPTILKQLKEQKP